MPVQKITLTEAVEDYISRRERAGFGTSTIANERSNLGALVRHVERTRTIQVRHVTSDHLFDLFYGDNGLHSEHPDRNGAMRKPINEATHNAYRKKIKQFNEYCMKRGWTKADWLESVPTAKEPETLRLQLTPNQMLRLVDSAPNPRDRIYIVACANTACRQSELKVVKRKNVNLDQGWLTVNVFKTKVQRRIPITAEFDAELRNWILYYEEQIGRPLADEDYLFPHRVSTGRTWSKNEQGHFAGYPEGAAWTLIPEKVIPRTELIIQAALKQLDPNIDIFYQGTHTLRRSIALAFQEHQEAIGDYGSALRATADLLNHQRTTTTEHYIGRNAARAQVQRMMHGKPFLTAMVDHSNVVPLQKAGGDR